MKRRGRDRAPRMWHTRLIRRSEVDHSRAFDGPRIFQ
jgi:hypothetical protein